MVVQGLQMRLGTYEADKIQDIYINLEPRIQYQLSLEQQKDPSIAQAAIHGDPEVKPEGMSQEQWQNEVQKKHLIDPYFRTARDSISFEKKLVDQRYTNQMMMPSNRDNKAVFHGRALHRSFDNAAGVKAHAP